MTRTAELRTSQVSADNVSEDTHKNISELEELLAALRAENSKSAEERDKAAQKQY